MGAATQRKRVKERQSQSQRVVWYLVDASPVFLLMYSPRLAGRCSPRCRRLRLCSSGLAPLEDAEGVRQLLELGPVCQKVLGSEARQRLQRALTVALEDPRTPRVEPRVPRLLFDTLLGSCCLDGVEAPLEWTLARSAWPSAAERFLTKHLGKDPRTYLAHVPVFPWRDLRLDALLLEQAACCLLELQRQLAAERDAESFLHSATQGNGHGAARHAEGAEAEVTEATLPHDWQVAEAARVNTVDADVVACLTLVAPPSTQFRALCSLRGPGACAVLCETLRRLPCPGPVVAARLFQEAWAADPRGARMHEAELAEQMAQLPLHAVPAADLAPSHVPALVREAAIELSLIHI